MSKIDFFPLQYIEDDRGAVLHFLKKSDLYFKKFGECYFSWINNTSIKGWYSHKRNTSFITSPTANLKVVLFDKFAENKISVIHIDKAHYGLIRIQAGVWYSFKTLNENPALIVNILDNTYDPRESDRLPISTDEIPFDWNSNA